MKWFKSRKQKRIEELEKQVDDMKIFLENDIEQIKLTTSTIDDRIRGMNKLYPSYTIRTEETVNLVTKVAVPRDYPITTEDISIRMANSLAEQVAKYMVVQKDFMRDPLADDVYRAMVRIVPYPIQEKKFYEI